MIGLRELDRLLVECFAARSRLSSGERRTLRRLVGLRRQRGAAAVRHVSLDELELLEDWAAAGREACESARPLAPPPASRHTTRTLVISTVKPAFEVA